MSYRRLVLLKNTFIYISMSSNDVCVNISIHKCFYTDIGLLGY